MDTLHERQMEILRAIVEEYVATEEPVGSKSIAQRHGLGVSPATIRNDMSVLEDAGYITHPHTSAGRIPTDRGYRFFVDRLAQVKPLSSPERRAIETFLEGALDLDEIVSRTVRLLAQITKQVAVVQYPSLSKSKVRHIETLLLTPTRVMIVLISDTGRVEQRVVELPIEITPTALLNFQDSLNKLVMNELLSTVSSKLESLSSELDLKIRPAISVLILTIIEMSVERNEEKIALAGTANLARLNQDFSASIHPILEALEEQVVLMRLLSDVGSSVQVRIGDEKKEESLRGTSLVTIGYGADDNALGAIGVLGPTRMDYAGSMAAVNAVARYIGQFLTESA